MPDEAAPINGYVGPPGPPIVRRQWLCKVHGPQQGVGLEITADDPAMCRKYCATCWIIYTTAVLDAAGVQSMTPIAAEDAPAA